MAQDDKDPEKGSSAGDQNAQDEDYRELFVDRDDDSSSPFIDSDYGDDFPGSSDEAEDVDPGYAAFASELEDPLADWPSPDAPLDELPEIRQHKEASDEQAATQSFEPESKADLYARSPNVEVSGDEPDDEVLLSFSSEDLAFDDTNDSADTNAPDVVDADDFSAPGSYEEFQTALDEPEQPEAVKAEAPPDEPAADAIPDIASYDEPDLPSDNFPIDDDSAEEPLPEQNEAFGETSENFEEEFVDDFLNDLDPPREEDELPAVDDLEDDFEKPMAAAAGIAKSTVESTVERAAPYEAPAMNDVNTPANRPPPVTSAAQDEDDRGFPLGMIAVVGVALVLLGIGGYGVMQQRSDMQAEIRELQAKLATTISPEEAEMERERQRQVQLQNESLNTELEALSAENSALTQQLAELEALQSAQISAAQEKRAQEEAAAKAAAERAAQQAAKKKAAAQSSTTPASSGATAKGPWFVNFGSYADRTIAERWAKKLTVDSGEVVVQTASAGGKTLYRVRVTGLTSQDSAERVATALERQYQLPRLWVGKN